MNPQPFSSITCWRCYIMIDTGMNTEYHGTGSRELENVRLEMDENQENWHKLENTNEFGSIKVPRGDGP